jgi:hypothetical protein
MQANQELTKRCLLLDVENEGAKSAHAALLADRRGLEAKLAAADAAVRTLRDDKAGDARELAEKAAALSAADGELRRAQEQLRRAAGEVRAAEEAAVRARMEAQRAEQERAAALEERRAARDAAAAAEARAAVSGEAEARERAARGTEAVETRRGAEEEVGVYRGLLDAERTQSRQVRATRTAARCARHAQPPGASYLTK